MPRKPIGIFLAEAKLPVGTIAAAVLQPLGLALVAADGLPRGPSACTAGTAEQLRAYQDRV